MTTLIETRPIVDDIVAGCSNLYVAPGDTSSVQNQLTPPATQPDPDIDPDVLIAIYENGWHFVYATYTGDVYYLQIMTISINHVNVSAGNISGTRGSAEIQTTRESWRS